MKAFVLGLACCTVEVVAGSEGVELVGTPEEADVLVVSGTVTDAAAPTVLELHRRLPDGARVMSFGACSCTGGPYWDSYCVTKGVDQLVPVDAYVPGCPPRPEAFEAALRDLA